jgi:hypothetical protein
MRSYREQLKSMIQHSYELWLYRRSNANAYWVRDSFEAESTPGRNRVCLLKSAENAGLF